MRLIRAVVIVVALPLFLAVPSQGTNSAFETLVIYAESDPPFNYQEQGRPKGASIEILLEIFRRLNVQKTEKDIVFASWARGFSEAQHRKNTMVFSAARTPEREHQFKWVGPINSVQGALISRHDNPLNERLEQDLNIFTYGITKDSWGEKVLFDLGIEPSRIIYVNSNTSAVELLARGRIDAWASSIAATYWYVEKLGYDRRLYKPAYTFPAVPHYFAFNINTSDHIISQMQKALNSMTADGILQQINQSHGIYSWQIPH